MKNYSINFQMLSKVLKISIRSLVGVVSSQTKRLYTDRQIEKKGQKQWNQRCTTK